MKNKVFCIGFHKTGTTSLAEALELLGYRVTGPNGAQDPDIASKVLDMAFELAEQFDAFQDNPWPLLFRELDARYPGSKFILTRRPPQEWITSQVKHFGTRQTPMRKWIYGDEAGCPQGNEELYLARYNQHNQDVLDHFAERPQDLLIMDLPAGDGWDKLCGFLGTQPPKQAFPHANKASSRDKRSKRKR